MSTIKTIREQLKSATKPILKPLHKNGGFNVFVIGMNSDMILSAHKAKWPSKLTVLEGSLDYLENDITYPLSKDDEKVIEPNIIHELKAKEYSICLLTQSRPD